MGIYKFNPDDAERFAHEQGIRFKRRGRELILVKCPYCQQLTSDKETFAINLDTGAFNCLRASCGAKGNMLTLARDFNFSLGTEVDEYFNSRKRYKDLTRYPRPEVREPAVEYMQSRGISKTITEKYSITTQKDHDNILVFPFFDEHGKMQFAKYRKTDFNRSKDQNKEWCEAGCKPILFGMDHCDPDRSGMLIMTEGQIDSLSVAEAYGGDVNVVSVPTGARGFTWVPYCWDFLGWFNTLVIFGDHEHDHITLLDEMRSRFHGNVMHVSPENYLDCKDANEILLKHGPDAVKAAVETAVMVENSKIKKLSDVEPKDMSQMEGISTGLPALNRTIGGFYFGQLVIVTGERGLGKSTLTSQFIAHAIRQGVCTFCYSGELPEWYFQDWFDRQAAGKQYINSKVSDNGYISYSVDGAHIEQIHKWYDDLCYIYDNTTLEEDADENEALIDVLESAVKQYGCRMLLVDNLMTALEDDLKSDLYRQQTQFVRKLAQMAKQYNVLIMLIVHPRKTNGDGFRNDDVAGSSNITNLADVVLRYAKPKEDEKHPDPDPADRVLQITKNRLNGRLDYDGIKLWYEDESKRISEDHHFNWPMGWEPKAEGAPDGFLKAEDMDIPF